MALTYVIADRFPRPLYWVEGLEWTEDPEVATWFPDAESALTAVRLTGYQRVIVLAYEPKETL